MTKLHSKEKSIVLQLTIFKIQVNQVKMIALVVSITLLSAIIDARDVDIEKLWETIRDLQEEIKELKTSRSELQNEIKELKTTASEREICE